MKKIYPSYKTQNGFTVLELLIAITIVATLFGIVTINLLRAQRTTSLDAAIQTFETDIKNQQIKAMVGATTGKASTNFGLYIQSNSYILFHGLTYNPSDQTNFLVNLDNNITISSTTFPNGVILFSQLTGNLVNFTQGQNTITVRNSAGTEQKTITLNRYGVITSIQ